MMDTVGNKVAKGRDCDDQGLSHRTGEARSIDWAIQAHGGGGLSEYWPLAYMYAVQRSLRFADGPDEVHRSAIAKIELAKYA